MTPQKCFTGILLVLLIGLAAYGARIGSAQDGTPVSEPGATPQAAPSDRPCIEIGATSELRVVLELDGRPSQAITPAIVDRTVAVLAHRAASVSPDGCDIVVQADGSVRVSLAASPALDTDTVVDTLTGSALLEIVDTRGIFPEVGEWLDPERALLAQLGLGDAPATPGSAGSDAYPVILSGEDIDAAFATVGPSGGFEVGLALTDDAAGRFAAYTAEHIGDPLAIVLDGKVVSVPVIQAEIPGGQVVIAGNFTETEAQTLATQLQAGALPVTLTVRSVQLVTPDGQTEDVPVGEVDGAERFTVTTTQHSTGPIAYPQSPPIGGMHDPAWQACGFYDAPVRNENAVHTLEHGVVWITYHPDLAPVEIDALRLLTLVNDRLLISPYPGLDAPVVLSTWDRQLRLDTVDDPRLFEFTDDYSGRSPEPSGAC